MQLYMLGGVNGGTPGLPPEPKVLTADQLIQLEKKDKPKYLAEMAKRFQQK